MCINTIHSSTNDLYVVANASTVFIVHYIIDSMLICYMNSVNLDFAAHS